MASLWREFGSVPDVDAEGDSIRVTANGDSGDAPGGRWVSVHLSDAGSAGSVHFDASAARALAVLLIRAAEHIDPVLPECCRNRPRGGMSDEQASAWGIHDRKVHGR